MFLSNQSKLKSEIKKNVIKENIYEKNNLKVSTKDIKVGRTPVWGYLEFISYIIVWNIWKLKKFLSCAFGFANLDIC